MAYKLFQTQKKEAPWWYPGKIRKSVLVFFGISVLLSPVLFVTGQMVTGLWYNSSLNPDRFVNENILNSKANQIEEIQISKTEIVDLSDDTRDLYTIINNKINPNQGYDPFVYELTTLDINGTVLDKEIRQTFLDPGDLLFIIKNTKNTEATNLQIKILKEDSKAFYKNTNNPDNIPKPDIKISNREVILEENSKLFWQATIYNPEVYDLRDLELTYILRDNQQEVLGIGTYVVSKTPARDTVDLKLEYPLNKNQQKPIYLDLRWRYNN